MRQWYLACNTFPPGAALTLVGQGEALCLVSPSVALSAHLVKQPLQVGEALLGQESPGAQFFINWCVWLRRIGARPRTCNRPINSVEFGGLNMPLPILVFAARNLAALDGSQNSRFVQSDRLGRRCKGVRHVIAYRCVDRCNNGAPVLVNEM